MFRSSLKRTSLLRSALFRSPLVRTLADLFDKLKNLSQPMVVAYEGDNPLETGRYPQPTTVLRLAGGSQHVLASPVVVGVVTGEAYFKLDTGANAHTNYIFCGDTQIESGLLRINAGGALQIANSTDSLIHSTPISENVWYHVKWSIGGGVATMLDLDGVEETGATSTNGNLSVRYRIGVLYNNTNGFEGVLSNVIINNSNYPFNQSNGTTAYDRSEIQDGSLINGASWDIDNALPWQADVTNEEGYTLGTGSNGADVGVIIPPSTIDPTKDCLGNDLQFSGSVYPVIPVPEGGAEVSFNGTTHYLSAPHLTGSETVTSHEGTATPTVSAGRVDFTAGTAAELALSDGTRYGFTETSSTDIFDTSGNGNHATLVNGPTWVFTRDGYGTNLNQLRGFTLDGAVRIPALADGSGLDARDGLPLTNPPVLPYGHNDSENTENAYEISETGSPTAASTNLSNFSAVTFSDTRTDLQTTLPVDAVYRRDFSTVKKDRLIAFYDTLTGDDKELAEQYTEPPTFSYSPSLDFSDGRNSQYLPLI